MIECKYCGESFSDSVIALHEAYCAQLKKSTTKKEKQVESKAEQTDTMRFGSKEA